MLITTNETGFIPEFNAFMQTKLPYQYVYISLGSKFNQADVYFNAGSNTLTSRVDTNAVLQMVPMFLRKKPEKYHILNIIIDIFPTHADMVMNTRLINEVVTDNMDCILINMKCTYRNIQTVVGRIMELVNKQSIPPLNMMLCNYIKFMNEPNMTEYEDELMIPKAIQNVLYKTKYENTYYEWYGYKMGLYDCIYNVSFSKRDLYFYQTTMNLIRYINLIAKMHIKNPCNKIEGLLHNSYDITCCVDIEMDCNPIAYPIKYTLYM